ncbi:hypothetical protein [Streptomyces sp. LN325]|uniref:hypothetical protein n=1 Tax=Streptomyces sp. LN325 TaxID=3112976 RepID=UPI003722209F
MAYIPTAVTAGHLREPDPELPLYGSELACRINARLAAGDRLHGWNRTPNEPPRFLAD